MPPAQRDSDCRSRLLNGDGVTATIGAPGLPESANLIPEPGQGAAPSALGFRHVVEFDVCVAPDPAKQRVVGAVGRIFGKVEPPRSLGAELWRQPSGEAAMRTQWGRAGGW